MSIVVTTANSERSSDASRRACHTLPSDTVTLGIEMATLDSEPFGEPTLLLGSSLLSDKNGATTFTSNGLLDTGLFDGSGDGGEGESASSAQSPSWAPRTDRIGSADGDEPSTFVLNGLLDGPTQATSTVVYSYHLFGAFLAQLRFYALRSDIFDAPERFREPLFGFGNSGWVHLHPDLWSAVRYWSRWTFDTSDDIRRKTRLY